MKTYTEMMSFDSFNDRFNYLKLHGRVGEDTFGFDRYLNQEFYKSKDWKRTRSEIILRDCGFDLSHPDHEILGTIYIHHLNPISKDDVIQHSNILLDPENLVCVSYNTHQAIHYGDESLLYPELVVRQPNDTCPWR